MRHGEILSLSDFRELIASPLAQQKGVNSEGATVSSLDSPLLIVVESWLREDRKYRRQNQLGDGEVKGRTKWDELKDNMRENGDRYYNYWYREEV
jgi:CCR4-NOT complex subunit CAF16